MGVRYGNHMASQNLTRRHPAFKGRIGFAQADITPPVGIYHRNWGAAAQDTASSVHRPLNMTAMALQQDEDGSPLILIEADLGWWRPMSLFESFRDRLLSEAGLQSDRFIFSLTHTHAAPPLMETDERLPGSEQLQPWLEHIHQCAVETIESARLALEPAILEWHSGRCNLAANRDLPDPENPAARIICGFNPNAEADDTLLVGRISNPQGEIQAVLVNYACHPTTLAWENNSLSPDYIGALRQTVQTSLGADVRVLFLQGMSGDLAPKHQYVGEGEVADRHGRQLGHAALATLYDMDPPGTRLAYTGVMESGAPLAVWKPQAQEAPSTELAAVQVPAMLPLKDWPSAAELEQQRQACTDRTLEERLRRKRDIRRSLGDGQSASLPVHVWKIGDAMLVGTAGEAYSVLQQDLRSRFPDQAVICMNLINGSVGYLPPAELYDVDVYPVWQTPFDRGSLEIVRDAMQTAVGSLGEPSVSANSTR